MRHNNFSLEPQPVSAQRVLEFARMGVMAGIDVLEEATQRVDGQPAMGGARRALRFMQMVGVLPSVELCELGIEQSRRLTCVEGASLRDEGGCIHSVGGEVARMRTH